MKFELEPIEIYNKWKGIKSSDGDQILAESYFFFPFDISTYIELIKRNKYPLISTEIWPSIKCNHKCTFCSTDKFLYENKDRLSMEKLIGIVDDLSRLGNKVVRFSGGGEPFIVRNIERVIRHVSKKGMKSSIITNCTMVDENAMNTIAEYTSVFRVSINAGTKRDYKIVHRSDDFNKVIRTMERISDLRQKQGRQNKLLLGATFVVTPDNYERLYEAAQTVKNVGFDFFLARACNPIRHRFIGDNYDVLNSQLERCHDLKDETFNFSGKIDVLDGSSSKKKPVGLSCYSTYYRAYISNSGVVYPCFSSIVHQKGEYGNIHDESFADIWQGRQHINLRTKLGKGVLLPHCTKFCSYVKFNTFTDWVRQKTGATPDVKFKKVPKEWAYDIIENKYLEWF